MSSQPPVEVDDVDLLFEELGYDSKPKPVDPDLAGSAEDDVDLLFEELGYPQPEPKPAEDVSLPAPDLSDFVRKPSVHTPDFAAEAGFRGRLWDHLIYEHAEPKDVYKRIKQGGKEAREAAYQEALDSMMEEARAKSRGLTRANVERHWAVPVSGPRVGRGGYDAPPSTEAHEVKFGIVPYPGKPFVQIGTRGLVTKPDLAESMVGKPLMAIANILDKTLGLGLPGSIYEAVDKNVAEKVFGLTRSKEAREAEIAKEKADLERGSRAASTVRQQLIKEHGIRDVDDDESWFSINPIANLYETINLTPASVSLVEPGKKMPARWVKPGTPVNWDTAKHSVVNSWDFITAFPAATVQLITFGVDFVTTPDELTSRVETIGGLVPETFEYTGRRVGQFITDPAGFLKEGFIQAGLDIAVPFVAVRSAAQRVGVKKLRKTLKDMGDKAPPDFRKLNDIDDDAQFVRELQDTIKKHEQEAVTARKKGIELADDWLASVGTEGGRELRGALHATGEAIETEIASAARRVAKVDVRLAKTTGEILYTERARKNIVSNITALEKEVEAARKAVPDAEAPESLTREIGRLEARLDVANTHLSTLRAAASEKIEAVASKRRAEVDSLGRRAADLDMLASDIRFNLSHPEGPRILSSSPFYDDYIRASNVAEGKIGKKSAANIKQAEAQMAAIEEAAIAHDRTRLGSIEIQAAALKRKKKKIELTNTPSKLKEQQRAILGSKQTKRGIEAESAVLVAEAELGAAREAARRAKATNAAKARARVSTAEARLSKARSALERFEAKKLPRLQGLRTGVLELAAERNFAVELHRVLSDRAKMSNVLGRTRAQRVADNLGISTKGRPEVGQAFARTHIARSKAVEKHRKLVEGIEQRFERRMHFEDGINTGLRLRSDLMGKNTGYYTWMGIANAISEANMVLNPLWGPWVLANRLKNKLIEGPGYLFISANTARALREKNFLKSDKVEGLDSRGFGRFITDKLDKGYLRQRLRDADKVIPELVQGLMRAGQSHVDAATFELRDWALKSRDDMIEQFGWEMGVREWKTFLLPTVREGLFFEHRSMRAHFNRELTEDYTIKFSRKSKEQMAREGFGKEVGELTKEAEEVLERKLIILNKHAAGLHDITRNRVTELGLDLGAFDDAARINKRVWHPQLFNDMDALSAMEVADQAITGKALRYSALRGRGVPIEARETPRGVRIDESAAWFKALKNDNPKVYDELKQRNKNIDIKDSPVDQRGGWGMTTDALEEVLIGIPDAARDFQNMAMFKAIEDTMGTANPLMSMDPLKKDAGWKRAPDVIPAKGFGYRLKDIEVNDDFWGALTKKRNKDGVVSNEITAQRAYLHPDLYWHLVATEQFASYNRSATGRALNYWKASKTIDSPGSHFTNFIANPLFLAPAAGLAIYNPANWGVILEGAKALFTGPGKNKYYKEFILHGGLGRKRGIGRSDIAQASDTVMGILYEGIIKEAQKAGRSGPGVVLKSIEDAGQLLMNSPDGFMALVKGGKNTNKLTALKYVTRESLVKAHESWIKIQNVAGVAYESGDRFWRITKFIQERRRGVPAAEAVQIARKAFADYENLAGIFNVIRQSWWGVPFLAYDARAIPQFVDFMRRSPHIAQMHVILHNYLSDINMARSGIDFGAAAEHVDTYKDLLPWYYRDKLIPWAMINPDAGTTARGGIRFVDFSKYASGARFIPLFDEIERWDEGMKRESWFGEEVKKEGLLLGTGAKEYLTRAVGGSSPGLTLALLAAGIDPKYKREIGWDEMKERFMEMLFPNFPLLPGSYSYNRIKSAEMMEPRAGLAFGESPEQASRATWYGVVDLDYTLKEGYANAWKNRLRSAPEWATLKNRFGQTTYRMFKKKQGRLGRWQSGNMRLLTDASMPPGLTVDEKKSYINALYEANPARRQKYLEEVMSIFEPELNELQEIMKMAGALQGGDLGEMNIPLETVRKAVKDFSIR
tara:strand:- start:2391 stop:8273 length:5883 start_codon:yes stop_codon:yes gene_type:complete